MNTQVEIFPLLPTRQRLAMPGPRSRRTDPSTSAEAADRHTAGFAAQAQRVLDLIRCHPGLTACELAKKATNASGEYMRMRFAISRRAADLAAAGFVRRGSARICAVNRSRQCTWYGV